MDDFADDADDETEEEFRAGLMRRFGPECWGNPAIEETPTPVGQPCTTCKQPIALGDFGVTTVGPRGREPTHRHCFLNMLGHPESVVDTVATLDRRPPMRKLYADFNAQTDGGTGTTVRLNTAGSLTSISKLSTPLQADERVVLTDYEREVEAVVKLAAGPPAMWLAEMDESTWRNTEDEDEVKAPTYTVPGVTHFVSGSCQGEECGIHYRRGQPKVPSTHKVGEEIAHDDPQPVRHNLTQYVCCECYRNIVGPAAPCS